MSTSTDPIEDLITVSTRDEPPTLCVVSKSYLLSTSPFFANLLEAAGKSESGVVVIPLEEYYNEIKGFFMVLEGDETGLESLRNQDWINLIRSADKYDCKLARIVAERYLWQIIAEGHHTDAFSLAVELELPKAIQKTWRQAIDSDKELKTLHDDVLKGIMLTAFKNRCKIVNNILRKKEPEHTRYNSYCECATYVDEYTWLIAAHAVNYEYKASLSVEHQLQEAINEALKRASWWLCPNCVADMLKMGKKADRQMSDELDLSGW
ncbi:hypothetical protein JCM5350_001214 [Sporobolomyces pararoseus]